METNGDPTPVCQHGTVGEEFMCEECGEEVCYCLGCDRTILVGDAYDGPTGHSVLCEECLPRFVQAK